MKFGTLIRVLKRSFLTSINICLQLKLRLWSVNLIYICFYTSLHVYTYRDKLLAVRNEPIKRLRQISRGPSPDHLLSVSYLPVDQDKYVLMLKGCCTPQTPGALEV